MNDPFAEAAARGRTQVAPYYAFIDGLRCLAVSAVLLFHVLPGLLPGGYVGVDVFFVISGFLIVGICLRERFDYVEFLAGRARRIVPAYLAVLLVSGLLACAVLLPDDLADANKALLAAPLFLQNFVFWTQTSYFSPMLERNPFLHTWSLAVEWQFYLVFPLLLRPFVKTRWLLPVLLVGFAVSLLASSVGALMRPTPTFFLTPFRVWEFLLGGFVGMAARRVQLGAWWAWGLAAGGLLALLGSALFYSRATVFPGATALLPCFGTAALLLCGLRHPDHPLMRLLCLPPIRLIGQASYSIYLVHWPLLVFARYFEIGTEPAWVSWSLIACACALGVLSWRYVEQPFRRKDIRAMRRPMLAAATAVGIASVAVVVTVSHGLPGRFPEAVLRVESQKHDVGRFRECLEHEAPHRLSASACRLGGAAPTPDLVLWGDSFAAALAPGIDEQARAQGISAAYIGTDSCPPLQGYPGLFRAARARCQRIQDALPRLLAESHPKVLILHATWRAYYEHDRARFSRALRDSFHRYAGLADHVVVVGTIPQSTVNVPEALARSRAFHLEASPETSPQAVASTVSSNNLVHEAARAEGFVYVDPMTVYCAPECSVVRGGLPLYFDSAHITASTARELAGRYREQLLGVKVSPALQAMAE